MNKRPKVQTEADYGLTEFRVAMQFGVPPGATLPAIMMRELSGGRREIIQLLGDGRHYEELQAACVKVPELADLSKLPYEEFVEFIHVFQGER